MLRAAMLSLLLGVSLPVLADDAQRFDIPSQDLASSLNQFAVAADWQIVFAPELVKNLRAQALAGSYTRQEAIQRLLEGTGLQCQFIGAQTVAIRPSVNREKTASGIYGVDGSDGGAEGARRFAQEGSSSDAASSTSGQGSEEKSNAPGSLKSSEDTKLDEVVVTAQKRTERLQDVPVPVTTINTRALVAQNQLRLQDYYSTVPALSFSVGYSGFPTIALRGLTTGFSTTPTVGIVVDDVPYGSSTGAGGGNLVPDFDPNDLAGIEVLRGPQGTLYGASSLGGLIKIVTLDPSTEALSGRVQAGASSVYNGAELGYNARGVVNVPLSETFAVRASGFTRRDPGYVDNVQTRRKGVNRTDVSGGLLSALWRPSETLSLKLSALYQDIKAHGSSGFDPYLALGDLQQSTLRGVGGPNRQSNVYTATLKAKLGGVDLTALGGYSVNTVSDTFDWGYEGPGYQGLSSFFSGQMQALFGVPGAAQLEHNKTDKFSQELRLSASIGKSVDWLLGGFYTHENSSAVQDEAAIDPATGAAVGSYVNFKSPSKITEYAVFSDLTFHLTDRFNVQLGGRESQNRQTFREVDTGPGVTIFDGLPSPAVFPEVTAKANSFTYLVTPQFKISPDLMVYARLASGYRVGGANPGCIIFNTPCQFKPDTTTNYEIGAKGDFLDRLFSFDASLYYIDWKDIQLFALTSTGAGYTANGSRAKSEGVELSVESRPLQGLTLAAWATWDDAALTEPLLSSLTIGVPGDRLPYSSRLSGHFSVQQDFSFSSSLSGFVGASVSYVGERLSDFWANAQRQDLPGYAQLDLHAGVRRDSWTVNAFVTNVADKRGLLAGRLPAYPNTFYYIQPRTAGLSVSLTF